MGGIQQCCFEKGRNNKKNGLIRLTNNKIIKKNPTSDTLLKNYSTNNKKRLQNEIKKKNYSDMQLTGVSPSKNFILNKEETKNGIKIKKNRYKIDNNDDNDEKSTNTFDKSKEKKKAKCSSVENRSPRKNSCDKIKENDNSHVKKKKEILFHKKNFIKGDSIGKGRFGEVFSGLCISNGKIITIKYYKNLTNVQKCRIKKNINELYKLNHKNIIKAMPSSDGDIIDENGELRIAYESLKLRNVEELTENYGSLNEDIIKIYVKQLLEGLKYLHENNIYHKNLKPTNILVDIDSTIKISDCLIDSLILGNAKEIYNNLLKSDIIEYYIPPFFIKAVTLYKDEQNNNKNNNHINKQNAHKNKNIFDDWISYDLWFLGCLIIEVSSKKKPWSHYTFKNINDFFKFLNNTHLIPTIPQKLSKQCQELIKTLFDYPNTKNLNIYDKIFNLDFFKIKTSNNVNINNIDKKESKVILNDSQAHFIQAEDSNISNSNNVNSESGMQLGQILAKNKVVNILNNNNNDSFSVSYTVEDGISMSQSMNKLSQSQSRLSQSIRSKNINLNNININKFKNMMMPVLEAQIEQSPDPVKNDEEKNFTFNK